MDYGFAREVTSRLLAKPQPSRKISLFATHGDDSSKPPYFPERRGANGRRTTRDDHAVMSLTLQRRLGDDDITDYPLTAYVSADTTDADPTAPLPSKAVDGAFGRARVMAFVPVEIDKIQDKDGAAIPEQGRVAFRWVATDSRGQIRESEWGSVDIFPDAELERNLSTRRAGVRAAVDAVVRDQLARLQDVKSVLDEAEFGNDERDLLKSIRFRQGRIAQDADRAAQDLIAIFNAFVYGRLGSPIPNSKILRYLDAHHRTTYGIGATREKKSEWQGDPVFPYALYDQIVTAWQQKAIYDRGLLERMLAALRDGVDAAARAAPAVHQAAATAVEGDRAAVEALQAAQEAHLEILTRLQASIKGWQTLSDVTEALRGIVDEQRDFFKSLSPGDRPATTKDDENK